MKDLTENIKQTQGELKVYTSDFGRIYRMVENQLAMMEALKDIQEKMMRIEGKMRGIK